MEGRDSQVTSPIPSIESHEKTTRESLTLPTEEEEPTELHLQQSSTPEAPKLTSDESSEVRRLTMMEQTPSLRAELRQLAPTGELHRILE